MCYKCITSVSFKGVVNVCVTKALLQCNLKELSMSVL